MSISLALFYVKLCGGGGAINELFSAVSDKLWDYFDVEVDDCGVCVHITFMAKLSSDKVDVMFNGNTARNTFFHAEINQNSLSDLNSVIGKLNSIIEYQIPATNSIAFSQTF